MCVLSGEYRFKFSASSLSLSLNIFITLCMYVIDRHTYSILSGRGSTVFFTPRGKTSFSSIYIFVSIFRIYKYFCFLGFFEEVILITSVWFPHELNTVVNVCSFIYVMVIILPFPENYLLTDII